MRIGRGPWRRLLTLRRRHDGRQGLTDGRGSSCSCVCTTPWTGNTGGGGRRDGKLLLLLRLSAHLHSLGALVPERKTVIEAQRELRRLVHRHLVFVLASKLGKSTDAFMDPLVTVDLLSTRMLG
jgi:hypothetical protein